MNIKRKKFLIIVETKKNYIHLALTASIALVFTIGKSTNNNGNQLTKISLAVPCECGCPAISPQITTRIVNGEAAVLNSWPWQLLLADFSYEGRPLSYCGVIVIAPKHVLTAAHGVFGWSPRYVGVFPRLHVYNASTLSLSVAYMAERIYVHESYDDQSLNDDVAVIRLCTPISLDDEVSKRLVATGWGVMENVNRSSPGVLQQVCSQFGDSGGLLVRLIVHSNGKTYWQQVGTMSGTVDCGYQTNFPNVYAHVSYYNPWIIDKIRASP